jgi:hypothetical protein
MLTWITNFGTARFLSLVIAAAYFVLPLVAVVGKQGSLKEVVVIVLAAAGYLVMPLLCIWFGDEMGGYIGALPGPAMNKPTPGCLVKLGGWFLLFLPAIILLFSFVS